MKQSQPDKAWEFILQHHRRYGCVPTLSDTAIYMRMTIAATRNYFNKFVKAGKLKRVLGPRNSFSCFYLLLEAA